MIPKGYDFNLCKKNILHSIIYIKKKLASLIGIGTNKITTNIKKPSPCGTNKIGNVATRSAAEVNKKIRTREIKNVLRLFNTKHHSPLSTFDTPLGLAQSPKT